MWTMSSPKGVQKQSHSCSCQGCKATNHTGTLLNLPKHWNSPEPSGTFRKLPPEPTPAHNGTLRNLPEVVFGTYTTTHRNPPEPSGSCLRNLHQHTPELSTTCLRNLHQHTGTLQNLLVPSSGTCSSDPHRHTPELIWAEDPVSLRCWGKMVPKRWKANMLETT